MTTDIRAFVRESNRIEGILREPSSDEIAVTEWFLGAVISVEHVIKLVNVYQPNAVIRDRPTLNVRVGSHIAPKGGQQIVDGLEYVLADAISGLESAYRIHHRYETLHPFTDGNGRSGRAIWLWMMLRESDGAPLGFLHTWYYQSLQAGR